MLRKLVVLGVAAAVLAVGADLFLRDHAEDQLGQRVRAAVGAGGPVNADIDSFPFLGRLLVSGQVSRMELAAADVRVERLRLASIRVDLRDVRLDRDRLLAERKAVLRSIGQGTAAAEITDSELSRLAGVPITIDEGQAMVTVAGRTVSASARIRDNVLRLDVGGLDLPPIRLPRIPLLPCLENVQLQPGRLRVSCTLEDVPVELAGRAVSVDL